ncbi:MAG TPA: thiamine biosynthesis protein ApbE, partial [Nitrospiraceae bacterium]|nr:thiamine biosynthesis protein ApbE [Nitrospiraceae bacterium]
MKLVYCLLFAIYCSLLLSGCSVEKEKTYRQTERVMGTTMTVTVVSPSERKAKDAVEAAFAEVKRLDKLLSHFSQDSELSAINRASGVNPVKVSPETLEVIKKAVDIARLTGGAFDPTIGPVVKLWDFKLKTIPAKKEIKNALALVDYRKVRINESASEIFLEKRGMELNLGGIAKGYAADRAVEAIKAKGIEAALVAIAGDIKGFGLNHGGIPWKVGIQNPRPVENSAGSQIPKDQEMLTTPSAGDIMASFDLKDRAVSTSGDYQRFFVKEGERYHHILNPETGQPAKGLISVTVIASDGYMADALSTGVFVLGPERGIKLLESLGLGGIIVDSNNKISIIGDIISSEAL